MASAIDPDMKAKPAAMPAAARPAPAKPAAANPAAAARPAAPAPTPKPAPVRQPPQGDESEEEAGPTVAARLLKATPAWAVSMLVHVVALLAMALIVTEPPKKEATVSIVSTAPEEEEAFEDIKEDLPDTPVETTDPVTDIAVTSDVVVEDVKVVADAQDVDAAPLAVDMSEFGDITAPASDMMSTIGVIGGTGKGFGGRKNAAALAGAGGGGGETESAVDRALKWLIEHQLEDGSWDCDLKNCPRCQGKCSHGSSDGRADRTGATALAILPFLGRGYTHKDGPYQKQLEKGITYLANLSAAKDGQCYRPDVVAPGQNNRATMYSQGLATIALTEAFAMTQDEWLENPAQLALYFVEKAQDPDGGGWNYRPKAPGDLSVSGWQFMALKSGNLANLKINPATIKNGLKFLDSVESDSGANYGYRPGMPSRASMTALGLLCRMYGGWDHDHPSLARGVAFLSADRANAKNLYFNYYATQVMHHYGGEPWQAWNAKMKALLLPTQATTGHAAGSWYEGVDGGGKHDAIGGRLYVTSLATMMLEVYYRHLPIYGNQATKTGR